MAKHDFTGKVVFITGAASGIGRATAIKFAACGAHVAVADLARFESSDTVDVIRKNGGSAAFFSCDVSDEGQVESAIAKVVDTFGRLDFAYNNAGVGGAFGLVEDYPVDDWDHVFRVNLRGVFLCMKYEIAAIRKTAGTGCVVNCASVLSTVCYKYDSAYVASKFAVLGLTKNAALDYADAGIRINSVSPGFTYTPMIMKGDPEKIKSLERLHAAQRLANPEEIADGVMWLCSPESSFVIGHNLMIDGGFTLT